MDRFAGPGDNIGTISVFALPLRKEWQEFLADRNIPFRKSAAFLGAGHTDYAVGKVNVVPCQSEKFTRTYAGAGVDAEQDDPLNMGRSYTKQSR